MSPYEVTGNYYFHILSTPAAGMVWNTVKPKDTLSKKAPKLNNKWKFPKFQKKLLCLDFF